jgi:hypothetical protein
MFETEDRRPILAVSLIALFYCIAAVIQVACLVVLIITIRNSIGVIVLINAFLSFLLDTIMCVACYTVNYRPCCQTYWFSLRVITHIWVYQVLWRYIYPPLCIYLLVTGPIYVSGLFLIMSSISIAVSLCELVILFTMLGVPLKEITTTPSVSSTP